ncbi:hypothetical protein SAMN05216359_101187 [Roseateles sp. YR242]|nr:hypothetical protein SAMN05216359_101187 [Roseateles sp. YR242]
MRATGPSLRVGVTKVGASLRVRYDKVKRTWDVPGGRGGRALRQLTINNGA